MKIIRIFITGFHTFFETYSSYSSSKLTVTRKSTSHSTPPDDFAFHGWPDGATVVGDI